MRLDVEEPACECWDWGMMGCVASCPREIWRKARQNEPSELPTTRPSRIITKEKSATLRDRADLPAFLARAINFDAFIGTSIAYS